MMRRMLTAGVMPRILATGAIVLVVSGLAGANVAAAHDNDPENKPKKHAVAAPEINTSSAAAALILLGGGLIVLFGRKISAKA